MNQATSNQAGLTSRMRRSLGATAAVALLALAGCGGGGGDDEEVICVGGCPAQGITEVDDSQKAKLLSSAVADVARTAVPSGSYTGRVVAGLSGSASFTGHSNYTSGVSCGSNCVSSSHDTDVTIVFDRFRVARGGNSVVTLSGRMTLTDNTANRTTPTTSSSTGSIRVQATGLAARNEITSSDGRTYGQDDVVNLVLQSAAGASWSGTLQTANGSSYAF